MKKKKRLISLIKNCDLKGDLTNKKHYEEQKKEINKSITDQLDKNPTSDNTKTVKGNISRSIKDIDDEFARQENLSERPEREEFIKYLQRTIKVEKEKAGFWTPEDEFIWDIILPSQF